MGLFLWDSQPSKIFVGDTSISKVFLWDTQVRPKKTWNRDISNATLVSSASISWYIVYWIAFSDDGTKFYYQENRNAQPWVFYQFDLSTPRDVSTKSNGQTFQFYYGAYTYWVYPENIFFGNNGKFLCHWYIGSGSTGEIQWYELSTPRDVTTKTSKGTLHLSGNADIWLNEDWTKFWYKFNNKVYYKELTTARTPELWTQIASWAYDKWYISPGGKYVYSDKNATQIIQYSLWDGYDFSNATQVATLNKQWGWTRYSQWIWFNSTWDKMYICRWGLNAPYIDTYTLS